MDYLGRDALPETIIREGGIGLEFKKESLDRKC